MISFRKSPAQVDKMRKAGLVVWEAHQAAARLIEPGMTTARINEAVEAVIASRNAIPLFKGVPGKVPFPAGTCISVNDEVVHGIPGPRRLKEGDVVSIDIGAKLDGWCGDAAVTHPVGEISETSRKLLQVTEEALRLAIQHMATKSRWSQVAEKMERYVHSHGFAVIEELVGHGIGEDLWEKPQVPNYASGRAGDFKLRPGMVLAVEPMISVTTKAVKVLPDHWTYVTTDGGYVAHFEHTLALTDKGVRVLTAGPDGEGWALGPTPWQPARSA